MEGRCVVLRNVRTGKAMLGHSRSRIATQLSDLVSLELPVGFLCLFSHPFFLDCVFAVTTRLRIVIIPASFAASLASLGLAGEAFARRAGHDGRGVHAVE